MVCFAGCETKGLFIQLHAFFESHASPAKHFHQRLFSDCKYPLPHFSSGYSDWFAACYVCDCSGKPLLLIFKDVNAMLCF